MNSKLILLILLCIALQSNAQNLPDSILSKIDPARWSMAVQKKVDKLRKKLIAKTGKTLHHLQKEEEKVYQKQLSGADSVAAKANLEDIKTKYAALEARLKDPSTLVPAGAKQYIPHFDTLNTAFKFLNQGQSLPAVKDALAKISAFDNQLAQAEAIKNFINQRRQQLQQQLEQLGMFRDLKKYNKEVYYYSEQLKDYKQTLSDPDKIEKKAIQLLSKTRLFQNFMRHNSMLASLFRLPADPDDPIPAASMAGLQTRAQVNNLIQQQVAAGGPNAQAQFTQNVQQAQSQMQTLKDKILKAGGGSSDDILPQGFRPNDQKVKSFLRRLEYGTNMQSQKANNMFPTTTDLGFSVGYKINNNSVIGLGASYKLGLGRGWNHIAFSQEGAGLRSYLDWKIKGSFWMSGGYEMNYRTEFNSVAQLKELNAWQQSGLVGVSKVIAVKTKFFSKTKVQLLWDFLSYQQVPRTEPIVFRLNYSIK